MAIRIGILTAGGDCPGLNAAIRGVARAAYQTLDAEIVGIRAGYRGLIEGDYQVMQQSQFSGILTMGGTILGTSRTPFSSMRVVDEDNVDKVYAMKMNYRAMRLDCLVTLGGNGTHKTANLLSQEGLNVIGLPKTIDNDIFGTDFTFGFQTAVDAATDAVDKLVTTAASHHRVLILEVMGRYAGWIALHASIAGGAEVCLIPEIDYDITSVMEALNRRITSGKGFANIVIAEGAKPLAGTMSYTASEDPGAMPIRLGGAGLRLSQELKDAGCSIEIRETILGHLQRGGRPNSFDRVLASQFGVMAFEMVLQQKWGQMASYRHPDIVAVPLADAIKTYNHVDPESGLVRTARGLGICLGD